MYCIHCGTKAVDVARFCSNCGKAFPELVMAEIPAETEMAVVEPTTNAQPLQTLNEMQPQTKSATPLKNTRAIPHLWNPIACANWSLLFSPAFGAYLQSKNWDAIGNHEAAKVSRRWMLAYVFILIGMMVAYIFYPLDSIANFIKVFGLPYLLVWYFSSGRYQSKYVKILYGKNYPRKSWGLPIVAGFSWLIASLLIGLVLGVLAGLVSLNSDTREANSPVSLTPVGGASYAPAADASTRPISTPKSEAEAKALEIQQQYQVQQSEHIKQVARVAAGEAAKEAKPKPATSKVADQVEHPVHPEPEQTQAQTEPKEKLQDWLTDYQNRVPPLDNSQPQPDATTSSPIQ